MTVQRELAASALTDLLFEEPGVGRCLVAPDGTVLRANAEWLRSTGLALVDVLGASVVDLFPGTRDTALAMHARARAGHRVEVPRHAQRVQGRETWWEGSITPVPMDGGAGLLITAREVGASPPQPPVTGDLAEPERAEAAASESERRLRALTDMNMIGVLVADFSGAIIDANEYVLRLIGRSRADLVAGRIRWNDITPPGWEETDRRAIAELRERGVVEPTEKEYLRSDGVRVPVLVAGARIGGSDQAICYVLDLTVRKRADEALRHSEERFRLLANTMPQIVCVLRPDGSAEYVNPTWMTFSGLDAGATARAGWGGIVHPDDLAAARACRHGVLKQLAPQDVELRFRAADGDYRWFLSRLAPVVEDGRVVRLVGAGMDITDRKRIEMALRESEQRYRTMGETLPYGVWLCNAEGGAEYASQSFLDLLEMTQEEQRQFGWTRRLPPEDVQPMLDKWLHCIRTGTPWDSEHRVLGPDGTYHHVLTRGLPVRDETGRITCWVGINLDIDERKRMEQELREADRRKDEFLGMLSHELRNPLAPIRNSVYILRHGDPRSEQAQRAQDVIERQTEHLTRLVDDLLDVTRIARGKIELRRSRVDLREIVSRAAEDFRLVMRDRSVAFEVAIPDAKLWADVDPTRITQVVGNLLHNASKFTRAGDTVTLSLSVANGGAEVRVRDTGAGIEPGLLPKVFDPFVQGERTLARAQGGLGLGLALVKGVTELHGGTVRVESAGVGRGAEFVVRLPTAAAAAAWKRSAGIPERSHRGRRVLVIDDNADAAESLADIVKMLGHAADVAYDGPSALEKARANPPDVVLCDIGLPGLSGYDVARALRAAPSSGMQLIALSGYAQPDDVKRAVEAGFDGHVSKPADPAVIERLLAK